MSVWLALQGGLAGRLGPGARTIQLSSESPLTFPMAAPNHGISDAIDAAIHTDLPAHPYSGLPFLLLARDAVQIVLPHG